MSHTIADPPPQSPDQNAAVRAQHAPWRDPLGALWQLLQRPWLLIVLGLSALLLILCALILPQLPAEITDNPNAVSRWLTEQSARIPIGGNILRAFGLFDVLHSALLRLLLTLIGLTLLIHFADLVAIALNLHRLPKQIGKRANVDSPAVSLLSPMSIYRRADSAPTAHESRSEIVQAYLQQRFGNVIEIDVDLENEDEPAAERATETRILARRNLQFSLLRPLLMLGLVLSLMPVWNIIVNGWELSPAPLAPGESTRYESNQLFMRYEMADEDNTNINLRVQVGEDEQIFPINGSLRATLNQVEIRAAAGPPALRISTVDGQERLALREQSAASSSVGLVFAEPGNEGIVGIRSTIPEQATILRIVRGPEADQPNYLIEVISQNSDPAGQPQLEQSIPMRPDEEQKKEISAANIRLQIDSVSGLNVNARFLPTVWLFIPATLLVLAGAVGYWRQPTFLLTQIIDRGVDQTTTIYQSDSKAEVEAALESAQES